MSLPAQLNCGADFLTSKFLLDDPNLDHRQALLFPKAHVVLYLPHETITRNYKQELRNTRNDRKLATKMCTINAWTPQDFKTIDWNAHAQALQRQASHQTTFVKYLHNILPMLHIPVERGVIFALYPV